jgi:hypothetical protein
VEVEVLEQWKNKVRGVLALRSRFGHIAASLFESARVGSRQKITRPKNPQDMPRMRE